MKTAVIDIIGVEMSILSRKPKASRLPTYQGVPLEARLADPVWSVPIAAAGFDPLIADLVRVVGGVMVSAPSFTAHDGMPFVSAETGILMIQQGRVGIAVPDGTRIVCIAYDAFGAELNVGNSGMLKLVWAGRTYGIVFTGSNAEEPEGRELGNALLRLLGNGA